MQDEWVQDKVLAIKNLHYHLKESSLYVDWNTLIEQSTVAQTTPI